MPILNDIMEHEVIGPEIKKGIRQGELTVIRRQIEKRFGALPAWAEDRLTNCPLRNSKTSASVCSMRRALTIS